MNEKDEEKPFFVMHKPENSICSPSFCISNEAEIEGGKQFLIENQAKFQDFLDQIEGVQGDEVYGPISAMKQFLSDLKPKNSNFHIQVFEIDVAINKLIDLLNEFDINTKFYIIAEILECLTLIWRIYSFFGYSEAIPKLNSFLLQAFKLDGNKEINYSILNFMVKYSQRFFEQSKNIREEILAEVFQDENSNLLFAFLPTKDNPLFDTNPILSLANHYVFDTLTPNSPILPNIQTIINNSIDYISKCEELIIPIEEGEDYDENSEHIYEVNRTICDHISYSIVIFLTCTKILGNAFFDLYFHGEFPVHYIDFIEINYTSGSPPLLEQSLMDFLYQCAKSGIDITTFFNGHMIEFLYPHLVKLINNCNIRLSKRVSKLIYLMITINPGIVHYFINAGIQFTNAFRPERNCFNRNLVNLKLVSIILHHFSGQEYEFGIKEMVKYLFDVLMPQENDMSFYAFQILIDMFNFLEHYEPPPNEPEKDPFGIFLSELNLQNEDTGMMDEYLSDTELSKPTFELVALFDKMLKKHYEEDIIQP